MSNSFVQSNHRSTGAGSFTTFNVSLLNPVTDNDLLVIYVLWNGASFQDVTITDNHGLTWTRGFTSVTNGTFSMSMWYVFVPTGSGLPGDQVIATFPAAVTEIDLQVGEWSGPNTIDLHSTNSSTTFTSASTNSFTPAGAGELIIVGGFGNAPLSAGPGYTLRQNTPTLQLLQDDLSAAAGAQVATFGTTAGGACGCTPEAFMIGALVFKTATAVPGNAVFFNHT